MLHSATVLIWLSSHPGTSVHNQGTQLAAAQSQLQSTSWAPAGQHTMCFGRVYFGSLKLNTAMAVLIPAISAAATSTNQTMPCCLPAGNVENTAHLYQQLLRYIGCSNCCLILSQHHHIPNYSLYRGSSYAEVSGPTQQQPVKPAS